MKMLELPQTIPSTALSGHWKTRKLATNRFAAVASLYFKGERLSYVTVIAESRRKAERLAEDFVDGGQKALLEYLRAVGA